MVKGVSRRVIVVRSPDAELFEQAIFLLREDAREISEEQVLRQACESAEDYVRSRAGDGKTPRRSWRSVLLLLLGAGATGLAWALSLLLR